MTTSSDNLQQQSAHIQKILQRFLPHAATQPQRLQEAMRYAVCNGGKRIRPLLVYASGELFNASADLLDRAACAVEFIHCYSLVHDDLPAMDNDDLRRGKPTCHKAFDEATAILAGDALQTLAFEILVEAPGSPSVLVKMLSVLAKACGSSGMAGGQTLDLLATGKKLSLSELENLHRLKTGALIRASVQLGALAGNASAVELNALDQFADEIGLAFQIQDDILDIESPTEVLGKRQGADIALQKPTFPAILGMAEAKAYLGKKYRAALSHLHAFNHNKVQPLQQLAEYMVQRNF